MPDTKTISLDKFREKKKKSQRENKFMGKLVWLYCPKCETLEYTEVISPEGRYHNICGSMVKEAEVEVDLRAEATIARYNIKKLDKLITRAGESKKMFWALKNFEETYLKRLYLVSGGKIASYSEDIEQVKDRLRIKEDSELGLLISEFRHQPKKRFVTE